MQDNIDDECRKNVLIQKHILPFLPKAIDTGYFREPGVQETCCKYYDVRKLHFEDVNFFTSDFIAKFCEIHNNELLSLTLKNVNTNLYLSQLMGYLRGDKNPICLTNLHIETS